jgi:hypothetical protein
MARQFFANEIYNDDGDKFAFTVEDGPDGSVDILVTPETGYPELFLRLTNDGKVYRPTLEQTEVRDRFGPKVEVL